MRKHHQHVTTSIHHVHSLAVECVVLLHLPLQKFWCCCRGVYACAPAHQVCALATLRAPARADSEQFGNTSRHAPEEQPYLQDSCNTLRDGSKDDLRIVLAPPADTVVVTMLCTPHVARSCVAHVVVCGAPLVRVELSESLLVRSYRFPALVEHQCPR